jgi:hypothetical protein
MSPIKLTEDFKIELSPEKLMSKKLTVDDLEDSIIFCFMATKEICLSHSDFKFLLIKNAYKKIPNNVSSKKKERWNIWQKKFTIDTPGFIRWHPPFRQFNHENQLNRELDDLVKKGILLKDSLLKNYRISPSPLIRYYNKKTDDMRKIKLCDNFTIFNIDNLTFYGIVPIFDFSYKGFNKDFLRELKSIKKTVNILVKKFSEIEKIFSFLDVQQSFLRAKVVLNGINKTKYKKKDKRLGYRYLNDFLESHKIKHIDFEWVKKDKHSILKYKPEEYDLDKELSYKIESFLNAILDYLFKDKTIVFHPKWQSSKDINRLTHNSVIEFKKKLN